MRFTPSCSHKRLVRLLVFASVAGLVSMASAASRPPLYADLADRARAQPPEFAADALLRIADAPGVTDVAWKREMLEDAFHLAAAAQQPYARRNWTGKPAGPFDKAYAQGLDVCTLQCRAVHAMLAVDYKKARELFGEMPPLQFPRLSCDDDLVYDPSIFYETAGEVAARAFGAKEVAAGEPFHLLLRYAADVTSPVQVAPVARMLAGVSLKPAQFEALVHSFAAALTQLSGDDRSFSATDSRDADAALFGLPAECVHRKTNAQPLVEAWRAYIARQLGGKRCANPEAATASSKAGQCGSAQCAQLATQFNGLIMAPSGFGFTPEQKGTSEYRARLRQYLEALADWTDDDDPVEFFRFKTAFYSELFSLTPNGPDRDLLLTTLLGWLQQNGYQRDHPAEWFYAVNTLIVHAFADPAGMHATVRALRNSSDPVIALFSELERLLPRPREEAWNTL